MRMEEKPMKKQENMYYMEGRNGLTLRVPESRLAAMQSAGSGSRPKLDPRQRQQLKDELKRRIWKNGGTFKG